MSKAVKFGYGAAIVILILVIAFILFGGRAEGVTEHREVLIYKSVEVEAGDTLWSIADRYYDADHYANRKSYMNAIARVNASWDGQVCTGGHLIVPVYETEE